MYPYIKIMGKEIASYGVMVVIGALVTISVIEYRCYKRKKSMVDQLYFLAFSMIFTIVGAKIMYLVINGKEFVSQIGIFLNNFEIFLNYIGGGFVFYGGLLGAIVGAIAYGKYFHQNILCMIDVAVPGIPLFHCFGRIGCFMVGCCYGCQSDSFLSVVYTNALGAPNNVPLLPVQLFEAVFDILLLIVLLRVEKKSLKHLETLGCYLTLYGIARFCLEFLRGDLVRGMWLFLSTSQWISLLIVALGFYLLITKEKNNIIIHWLQTFENVGETRE